MSSSTDLSRNALPSYGVSEVRQAFRHLYRHLKMNHDVAVAGTLELTGVSFTADEPTIFSAINDDYVQRELAWYESQSLSVEDFPGGAPKIWRDVAAEDGTILSNYGHLFLSGENGSQFDRVVEHLRREPTGRRAVAVYTRPTVHLEWDWRGRRDFICTSTVTYLIRGGHLDAVVSMRSNDAVTGYKNDLAWQRHALDLVARKVDVPPGAITWQVASLHVYERHWWLLDDFHWTGRYDQPLRSTT